MIHSVAAPWGLGKKRFDTQSLGRGQTSGPCSYGSSASPRQSAAPTLFFFGACQQHMLSDGSEAGFGKVWMARCRWVPSHQPRPSAFAVGMLRDICKKTDPDALVRALRLHRNTAAYEQCDRMLCAACRCGRSPKAATLGITAIPCSAITAMAHGGRGPPRPQP